MTEDVPKIEKATVGKRTFFQRVFVVKHFLVIVGTAFIVLAILSRNIPYFQFDLAITRAIQSINIYGFNTVMLQLTNIGNTVQAGVAVIIISGLLFALNKKIAAFTTAASSLGLSGIGTIVKIIIARPRPDSLLIHQLGHFVKPDSFPSGHVLQFMGLYGFLLVFVYTKFKLSHIRRLVLIVLVFLLVGIGVSRIYVGAHWFSDVLGSYLMGFVWLYYVTILYNKYEKKDPKK